MRIEFYRALLLPLGAGCFDVATLWTSEIVAERINDPDENAVRPAESLGDGR